MAGVASAGFYGDHDSNERLGSVRVKLDLSVLQAVLRPFAKSIPNRIIRGWSHSFPFPD